LIRSKFSYYDVLKDPSLSSLLPKWSHALYACTGSRGNPVSPIPVSAIDFYDDIFGEYLEEHKANPDEYLSGQYGGILVEVGKNRVHRSTITRGQAELYDRIDRSEDFCLMSPISYAGRARSGKNARQLFALVVEIDHLTDTAIQSDLWESCYWGGKYLTPTYVVCSGTGVHCYWVFDKPLPLYPHVYEQLSRQKKHITFYMWNRKTSKLSDIQYEPVTQGFRVVGSKTKDDTICIAFKTGKKYSLDEWNLHFKEDMRIKLQYHSTMRLSEAKEMYPEWYARRIEKKLPQGHFQRNRAIYDYWLDMTTNFARMGHRYFCVENLCALALQCDISEAELTSDIKTIQNHFNSRSGDLPFTTADILCALQTYYSKQPSAWRRRVEFVSTRCGIPLIPAKRNGRSQYQHLQIARYIRDLKYPDGNWRKKEHKKPKEKMIHEWKASHPGESQRACAKDLGISRNTVSKYWG